MKASTHRLARRFHPTAWLVPLLAVFALLASPGRLPAQEAELGEPPQEQAAERAATAAVADDEQTEAPSVWDLLRMGGLLMWPIGLCSVLALAVILERLVNLRAVKVMPPDLVRDLERLSRDESASVDHLRALAERTDSPLAAVLRGGLARAGRPLPEVEQGMEDAAAREVGALRGKVRWLSVISGVAPLIGLLGTVFGMIQAFIVTSQVGTGKAEQLAEGIYQALVTTAAGLCVAIPAFLFYHFFVARIDSLMREMDERLLGVLPIFARSAARGELVSVD